MSPCSPSTGGSTSRRPTSSSTGAWASQLCHRGVRDRSGPGRGKAGALDRNGTGHWPVHRGHGSGGHPLHGSGKSASGIWADVIQFLVLGRGTRFVPVSLSSALSVGCIGFQRWGSELTVCSPEFRVPI